MNHISHQLMKHIAILISLLALAIPAQAKPLKIFILAGQSNMEGHAKIETFDYIGDDPATAPLLQQMRGADGKPTVCENVWISYFTGSGKDNGEGFGKLTAGYGSRQEPDKDGGKIGPEFTFGLTMDAAHDTIFSHFPHSGRSDIEGFRPGTWVRRGDWKLIRFFADHDDGSDKLELFNLKDDLGETKNLAAFTSPLAFSPSNSTGSNSQMAPPNRAVGIFETPPPLILQL